MNCKPGDIARIVNSKYGNNDKLVLVIEPWAGNPFPKGTKHRDEQGVLWRRVAQSFCWKVEALGSPIVKSSGKGYTVCPMPDVHLRPLRDPGSDAVDEMVSRVGPAPEQRVFDHITSGE